MSNFQSIFIVGPTASGKSDLSIELAELLGAEIICADSQTIRRKMDIGTAKPTESGRARVPHHMLDIIDPYEPYSLALFLEQTRPVLDDIKARGKKTIIVGGTGLYSDALYFNFELPELSLAELGVLETAELQSLVRDMGYSLPENKENPRHLVNTIKRGGRTGKKGRPMQDSLIIGINPGREVLIERINARVDIMFELGFVDEVRAIIDMYGEPSREFDAIGYRIAHRLTKGEINELEARELFKSADRQYAKRQLSWYKRNPDIVWFSSPDEAKTFIIEQA